MGKFAIIQKGYAIFGIGDTLEAAYRDAKEWTDDDLPELDEIPSDTNMHGEMFWAEITPALAAAVEGSGGDIVYGELPDGTLCTPEEEDE